MTKITFVNNTSPLLSAENLNAIQNNTEMAINEVDSKYTPQAIYCRLASNMSTTNTYTDVSTLMQTMKVGENLSVQSGKILVGSGINHIKVTCKLWIMTSQTTDAYAYIRKNSTNVAGSWQVIKADGASNNMLYTQALVDVSENDIITFSIYCNSGTLHQYSSIIVEKID